MDGPPLPNDLTGRPASEDDLPQVLELVRASDTADVGSTDYSAADLDDDWRTAVGANGAAWVVVGKKGVVGFATAAVRSGQRVDALGWVAPDQRGRGAGSWLAARAEELARERLDLPDGPLIFHWIHHPVEDAQALLRARGYEHIRSSYRMSIALDQAPVDAPLPDDVTVRSVEPTEDLRPVYEAAESAFADHWGHVIRTFEEWREQRTGSSYFDPSLWLLAESEGRIVAVSLCSIDEGDGWVDTLGVVPERRREGLGRAMLLRGFDALRGRGLVTARLNVDAENVSGATRLYEAAGMHVDRQYDAMAKRL